MTALVTVVQPSVSKVPTAARTATATSTKHYRGDAREEGGLDDGGFHPSHSRTQSRVATADELRSPQEVTDQ